MNTHKVKHHRNSDTKTANRDHIRTTALERSVMKYGGGGAKLVLRRQLNNLLASYKSVNKCNTYIFNGSSDFNVKWLLPGNSL